MLLCSLLALGFIALPPHPAARIALGQEYPIRIALHDADRIVDRVLESSLYRELENDPGFAAKWNSPDAKRGRIALRFLAGALETDLPGMTRRLLDRTIGLYVDPTAPGRAKDDPRWLAVLDLGDDAVAMRWLEVFDQAALLVGATDDALTDGEVRSINGKEFHTTAGRWIVASNDREALELAREALRTQQEPFANDGGARLEFEIDVARLRDDSESKTPSRQGNGIGALLGYGLDAAGRTADRLVGSIELGDDAVSGLVELFHPPLDAEELALDWYTRPTGPTPPALRPEGFIGSLRLDRDFAAFYRARDSWLAEDSENDFVQFDNGMNLFFGGRAFGDEILPALSHGALLVLTRQGFVGQSAPPAIRIPAFTLLFGVDAERLTENEFATAFQNSLAIINLDQAGKGGDSLLAGSHTIDETTIYQARYLPPKKPTGEPLDFRFNFTPALAVARDHVVIGSAQDGVAAVVKSLGAATNPRVARPASTAIDVDLAALGAVLSENREALIQDRMLKEGEDRAAASRAIDLFLLALSGCGDFAAEISLAADRHVLDLRLGFGAKKD